MANWVDPQPKEHQTDTSQLDGEDIDIGLANRDENSVDSDDGTDASDEGIDDSDGSSVAPKDVAFAL